MKKKLITLAKELDFNSTDEYFVYFVDSYLNGNFSQCKRLFSELRKEDQKELIQFIKNIGYPKEIYNFYFNLL